MLDLSWEWTTALVLLIGTAVYASRSWLLSLITPKGIPGVPAFPYSSPILGDIPKLAATLKEKEKFSSFFDEVGRMLGPVGQVRLTAFKTMVVVSDYQETYSIVNRPAQFERALLTAGVFRNIIPTGQISLLTTDMWKQHRRLMGPALTSKSLTMMTPRAVGSVKELVSLFEAKRVQAEGRPFNMAGDFVSAAMDVINGMAFGDSWHIVQEAITQVKSRKPTIGPLGEAIFETKRPDLADTTIYLLDSVPIKSSFPDFARFLQRFSPYWRREKKRLDKYLAQKLVESRQKMRTKGESAIELADNTLDMMVARELLGDKMPDNELIDEIFLYVVAGTETTAVTLSWYAKFMTNHPEVQRKLRAHLLERIPELQDRDMEYGDVDSKKVPYLEAVVQECLRLSRTASGFAREARVDTTILGYAIPKGTIIITPAKFQVEDESMPSWGEGGEGVKVGSLDEKRHDNTRHVGHWKAGTAKTFDPERWLKDGEFDPTAGPSMPFSGGQRGCFGKNLALLELRLVIAHMTMAFFFAPVGDKLNSMESFEVITTQARQPYIKLEKW